jgi:hypothetical protein
VPLARLVFGPVGLICVCAASAVFYGLGQKDYNLDDQNGSACVHGPWAVWALACSGGIRGVGVFLSDYLYAVRVRGPYRGVRCSISSIGHERTQTTRWLALLVIFAFVVPAHIVLAILGVLSSRPGTVAPM